MQLCSRIKLTSVKKFPITLCLQAISRVRPGSASSETTRKVARGASPYGHQQTAESATIMIIPGSGRVRQQLLKYLVQAIGAVKLSIPAKELGRHLGLTEQEMNVRIDSGRK